MSSQLDYSLIDSGAGRKLERFGDYILDRPAPQAHHHKRAPELWDQAQAVYNRNQSGSGEWEFRNQLPGEWVVEVGGINLLVRPTPFGHVGLFTEHTRVWRALTEWAQEGDEGRARAEQGAGSEDKPAAEVLNLFAYTGAASLALAQAGFQVTHVDSAKGIVDWARLNAEENPQVPGVRWIVEDVRKYTAREVRRGRAYRGLILDPPSFGRGPKGQVFKIEEHLRPLLDDCIGLLHEPDFVLFSCHSPNYSALGLALLLDDYKKLRSGTLWSGEMATADEAGRLLPAGCAALWLNETWAERAAGRPDEWGWNRFR